MGASPDKAVNCLVQTFGLGEIHCQSIFRDLLGLCSNSQGAGLQAAHQIPRHMQGDTSLSLGVGPSQHILQVASATGSSVTIPVVTVDIGLSDWCSSHKQFQNPWLARFGFFSSFSDFASKAGNFYVRS